jgi:lactoylglutathione lyase
MANPLFQKIDCIELPVPDLEAALRFYCDRLGHALVWRTATAAGVRMAVDDGTEIVLQTERPERNVDLLVRSASDAASTFAQAGGTVIVPPFDIQIGQAVVVKDPFGNVLVLLDSSKGLLLTDANGNIIGNQPPE